MRWLVAVLVMLSGWGLVLPDLARAEEPLRIYAAASLKSALDGLSAVWPGGPLTVSFAGSSTLTRQLQAGAEADIVILANQAWMDVLAAEGLLAAHSRRDLLTNRLVVIAADPAAAPLTLHPGVDLTPLVADGRMAMALVDAVPAGIYGKAALQSLGAWEALAPHVAQADNVRAALALVASGAAPYGIVYATDARAEPGVAVVAQIDPSLHPPIRYPVAALRTSQHPDTAAFLAFLDSAEAWAIFATHGFGRPD